MSEVTIHEKEEKIFKMLNRIFRSDEGPDLVEYLKELSVDNYTNFKKHGDTHGEFCRGYAVSIDMLVDCFEHSTEKLKYLEIQRMANISETDSDFDEEENPHG